eukprot:GEZU01011269.1.p1 GENE.GEZU01011269.1~~GEZU01011269.1.p1  ORF type:complete len:457 (+),score=176.32 GEZU01011269.1:140-1510(+)
MGKPTCFVAQGSGLVTPMLPDFSNNASAWNFLGQTSLNSKPVYHWQQQIVNGTFTNVYDFYLSTDGVTPVRFQLKGYDFIFGSHPDLYILDYLTFTPSVNSNDFAIPKLCGVPNARQGDAQRMKAPLGLFAGIFPCHEDNIQCQFNQFTHKHKKHYKSSNEVNKRMKIYEQNAAYIKQFNSEKHSHTLRMNQFGDMNDLEFKRTILVPKGTFAKGNKGPHAMEWVSQHHPSTLPQSVDWREKGAVSVVKDQGVCGSCWSFSTTGSIEGQVYLATGEMITLSEQNLVDCSWDFDNYGCDGGQQNQAFEFIIHNGGIETEKDYPYLMQDGYCHYSASNAAAKISGYVPIPIGDEQALMEAVATVGPISISIDASHPSFRFVGEGVYYEPACQNNPSDLDHAVLVVGYGTTTGSDGQPADYWIVKNSWSTYWGQDGYVLMARNAGNNCGIASGAIYPVL